MRARRRVNVFRQVPGEQQTIIQRKAAYDALHHVVHQRRAVGGYRVIEARRVYETVRLVDVGEE